MSIRNSLLATAFLASLSLATAAHAQDAAAGQPSSSSSRGKAAPEVARNAVYVELLGSAGLYSVNYDRLLSDHVSARVGVMFVGGVDIENGDKAGVLLAPVVASYLVGGGSNQLEAGLGFGLASAAIDDDELGEAAGAGFYGTGVVGFRHQPRDGGFVFRVGLTPLFTADTFVPWFGASFGYSF